MKTALRKTVYRRRINTPAASVERDFDEYKRIFLQSVRLNTFRNQDDLLRGLKEILEAMIEFSALALLRKEPHRNDFDLQGEYNLDKKRHKRLRRLESSGHLKWICEANTVSPAHDESGHQNEPVVIVPLWVQDEVVGALVLFVSVDPGAITLQQNDLLLMLGSQLAIALENLRLYEEMSVKAQVIANIRVFLESAVASMSDGLFAVDREGKFSLFNEAMETLTGFSKTQAIGSRFQELFGDEQGDLIEDLFKQTQISGLGQTALDIKRNDQSLHLEIRATALIDEDGNNIGMIAVCNDTTERRELLHLRQLDELKDEFLSAVSHELRTPLTAIKSFAEILQDFESHDAETRKEFLAVINKETDRLIVLIEDLLDMSQLSEGQFQTDNQIIDVNLALTEAMQSLQIVADKKSIEVVRCDPPSFLVNGDHKRLVQVYINLIGNAIKFSPAKTQIRIESKVIAVKSENEVQEYLQIAVADQGPGIPPESRNLIFEKFKQIRPDRATKPDGSGLGLWISKQIIENMGGMMWVERGEEKGSVFCFTLPSAVS